MICSLLITYVKGTTLYPCSIVLTSKIDLRLRAYLVRLEEALAVADPEGGSGFVRTPLPRPQSLNISETKLFHFHGIFKQIDIKSAKRTPSSTELIPLPEILDHPCLDLFSKNPGYAPA